MYYIIYNYNFFWIVKLNSKHVTVTSVIMVIVKEIISHHPALNVSE